MGKFLITEEEKSKILGMYYKTMGKSLVKEEDKKDGDIIVTPREQSYIDGTQGTMTDLPFHVFMDGMMGKQYYYTCVADKDTTPDQHVGVGKPGAMSDGDGKLFTPAQLGLMPGWQGKINIGCKSQYDYLANWRKTFCANPKNKTKPNYGWNCPQTEQPQAQVAAATTVATPTATDTTAASYKKPEMFKTTPYSPMGEYKKYIASGNLDPKQNADGSYTIIKDLNVNRPDRPGGIYKVGQTIKFTS